MKKCIIIGGGPAGIMSAIQASKKGYSVTLLEKKSSLGKKILISGNGRCNISNSYLDWGNYHGTHPKFTASVFSKFSNYDTINFFRDLGLEIKEEDNGRLFPVSNKSETVLDLLLYELEQLGVEILYKSKVTEINKKNSVFQVKLFNGKLLRSDKLIIATGGKTYPILGSSGDGYAFAKSFGHTITPIYPVSCGLEVSQKYKKLVNKLQGVKANVRLSAYSDSKKIGEEKGSLLFTHYGISAWAVMRISFVVSYFLNIKKEDNVSLSIDFFPDYDKEAFEKLLLSRWEKSPKKTLAFSFVGLLPKRLVIQLLEFAGFDTTIPVLEITKDVRRSIINIFKNYKIDVKRTRSWEDSQFTMGGVSVTEIDSRTMESKLVQELYFCGEVVDITGDSGGYNLQWAWSSGFVAGSNC